jgi:hypothetical protein
VVESVVDSVVGEPISDKCNESSFVVKEDSVKRVVKVEVLE